MKEDLRRWVRGTRREGAVNEERKCVSFGTKRVAARAQGELNIHPRQLQDRGETREQNMNEVMNSLFSFIIFFLVPRSSGLVVVFANRLPEIGKGGGLTGLRIAHALLGK